MRSVVVVGLTVAALVLASCSGSDESQSNPHPSLVLAENGIGEFRIGMAADEVISGLSSQLGGWDADSADEDTRVQVPQCPGGETRLVSWGNLVLLFVDDGVQSVFHTWSYGFDPVTGNAEDFRRLGLRTEEGIGLDSTRIDLEDAYGSRLTIEDDERIDLATYTIDGSHDEHLAGNLWSTDDDALVQLIERVPNC
ncbi:MAG: hypothetical protein ACR2N2_09860 [Acidimicrobiia bacterium]